jgi:SpoVK/Ycf46/Vps4 family AAA+-type ATPase
MSKILVPSLQDMENQFRSSVCNRFIIHGNISDHLPISNKFVSLKDYLTDWLTEIQMDIIMFFDISSGITFINKNNEMLFRKLTDLLQKPPEMTKDLRERLGDIEKTEGREKRVEVESAIRRLQEHPDEVEQPPLPRSPHALMQLIEMVMEKPISGDSTSSASKKVESASKKTKKCRVSCIIDFAEMIAPAENGTLSPEDRVSITSLKRLANDINIRDNSLIILVTKNLANIHSSLRGRGSNLNTVEIPLPQKEQRLTFIQNCTSNHFFTLDQLSHKDLAHNTGGLTLREISEICRGNGNVTLKLISKEKSHFLEDEFGNYLRIMDPRFGMDGLGGMECIKESFNELKHGLIKGDPRLVPPAVILMGPPGTGKTALAEAIAFEWGVPFVEILNVRNMFHGESERIAITIMHGLLALCPCVLFWDEFDQEEAPRGSWQGDSGVSSRLRKIRFQITSDPRNRGKFLVIYATNRVDLIDPADKRSGRASMRIPMLLPSASEQEKIFQVMPPRYQFETRVKSFAPLVGKMREIHGELISGADIEEISLLAYRCAANNSRTKVAEEDYLYSIKDFVPHHYAASQIKAMEEMAVRERSSNRFLMGRGLEILAQMQEREHTSKI